MKKLLVLLIACLALTLAACGGDDDDDDGGGATTTPTEQTDTGAPPPAAGGGERVTVDIPAIEFDPAEVTVAAGTTVVWTNTDDLPHTVTKEGGPGPDFDSGDLPPIAGEGQRPATFEQTFDQPGTIDYVCTIHPGQAGTVVVE